MQQISIVRAPISDSKRLISRTQKPKVLNRSSGFSLHNIIPFHIEAIITAIFIRPLSKHGSEARDKSVQSERRQHLMPFSIFGVGVSSTDNFYFSSRSRIVATIWRTNSRCFSSSLLRQGFANFMIYL